MIELSVSTSIFLSAVLIAFVLLFNSTKDRWNWKKILLIWPLKTVLVIGVVGGLGYLIYDQHQNRLQIAEQYGGVKLNSSLDDVFFLMGNELKIMVYDESKDHIFMQYPDNNLRIRIKEGKVWRVSCGKNCSSLNGIGLGTSGEELEAHYGQPDLIFESDDKLTRVYVYKKYKTYYSLEKNKVETLGIIELDLGMFDEEVKPEFMDYRHIKDKKTVFIKHMPMESEYQVVSWEYQIPNDIWEQMNRIFKNSKDGDEVIYDEYIKREEEKRIDEHERYERKRIEKERIAEEKREAKEKREAERKREEEARKAERKREEEARKKAEAAESKRIAEELQKILDDSDKKYEKKLEEIRNRKTPPGSPSGYARATKSPYSQIKPGMADWQVSKILGRSVMIEGNSSCAASAAYAGDQQVWYYSEKRKDGPYVEFVCNTTLGTFEVSKTKAY